MLGSKNVKYILSHLQKKRFRDILKASHLSEKSLFESVCLSNRHGYERIHLLF